MSVLRRVYDDFELAVCATVIAVGSVQVLEDIFNSCSRYIYTFSSSPFSTPVIAACTTVAIQNYEADDCDIRHVAQVGLPTFCGFAAGFMVPNSMEACAAAFGAACFTLWQRAHTDPVPRVGSKKFDLK